MAYGYKVFTTYILEPTGVTNGYGYSKAIHCNYIKSILLNTDNPSIVELSMSFRDIEDFKFLSNNIASGTGYTVHKIYALIQLIDNSTYADISDVKPIASNWYKYDITDQVTGHTNGQPLTAAKLTSVTFKIQLYGYGVLPQYTPYNLSYLNYPSSLPVDTTKLCFGDEIYFFGNVTTDIHADVYVTNLSIPLALNEFNSTTNRTWDSVSSVSISEIGIYDDSTPKNLVAIGKLNNPVSKDSTIARTILFAIDF